jgi:two-component system, chemotaxis family, CheB/CheR fusion protein
MARENRVGGEAAESTVAHLPLFLADAVDASEVDASEPPLAFTTVALGASAGGVDALQRFFRTLPADTGCAYVVLMHLDPSRESLLTELIGRCTTMTVTTAEHGMALAPDKVYVIPPGQFMELSGGRLTLEPIAQRAPRPITVDRFMISAARDQRHRMIGVVMTGADGDGALGLKAIKSEGGMTIAQSPESAPHPGMPLSAISAGAVDVLLQIEQMPQAIVDFLANSLGESPEDRQGADDDAQPLVMAGILAQVRLRTGLDFRGYKQPMLARRIRRRMALCGSRSAQSYMAKLAESVDEARALADDFLISVTEFFREPDAWRTLSEDVLPNMLMRKDPGETVRIWVPACATGEEAYSIGMAVLEQPAFEERQLKLQIFATDVDRRALEVARQCSYPESIVQTVTPERLGRFFTRNDGRFQICKPLREAVIFAPQNVTLDPPFSRIDLLSCRNLLIYLEPELQRRALNLFHFALEPGGILFLGKSETVSTQPELFAPLSQRHRIYRRLGGARVLTPSLLPAPTPKDIDERRRPPPPRGRNELAELVQGALLAQYAPAAVLIDREHHTLYFHGRVAAFLEQPVGAPTVDLFAMLPEGMRPQLRVAIHKVVGGTSRVETHGTMRGPERSEQTVRMVVSSVQSGGQAGLVLVTFERQQPAAEPEIRSIAPDAPAALQALETELQDSRKELRGAIEELEATNEELKVANEEAMSMNEELQSTNEELETSKEELQSVNEELTTVNHQLQEKVIELESTNNDLGNLLSSTHIATLFLDRQLRIKRFTPAATRLFRLISSDLGRPLTDIAGDCDTRSLLDDARQVLAALVPLERQVETVKGHFLQRILPYRTRDDHIEGVVVTFTDVTEVRQAAEQVRQYAAVMHASLDAILVHDLAGKIRVWNQGATAMYGHSEAEALELEVDAIIAPAARTAYRALVRRVVAGDRAVGVEAQRVCRDGTMIDVSSTLSLVHDDAGRPAAIALTDRDITARLRAEVEVRESEARFRTLANSAAVLIWMTNFKGRLEFVNDEFEQQTGESSESLIGRQWTDLVHPDDHAGLRARKASRGRHDVVTVRMRHRDGDYRWMALSAIDRLDSAGQPIGQVGTAVDVHSQKLAEEALRAADRRKDEFLAMLGHELRNPLAPIRNAAEVLRLTGSDDPRIRWVCDTLIRQVAHVTRLVDDLLDISRITRGVLKLRFEPVELRAAITRAIDATRAVIQERRHRFELNMPHDPIWVDGDAIRLTQIFENLLTNAAKYTDEGGDVSLTTEVEGDSAVIHIRDSGIGIAPWMRGQVFDLFVQDQRSVDRSQGGLGIGLALVRHLVEVHHGRVEAFSEGVGRGSDFVVRLPILAPLTDAPDPEPSSKPVSRTGRVMIVDDDPDAAESMALVLQIYGYEVAYVTDLDSALRTGATLSPQVVILDLGMPGADGYEVARRLRILPQLAGAVFVALTGFGRQEDIDRTRQHGFAYHFVKPADPQELHRMLQLEMSAMDAAQADAVAPLDETAADAAGQGTDD